MAFTLANWAPLSSSLNQGQETVTPFLGVSTVINAANIFMYNSPLDNLAAITTVGYFNSLLLNLNVNDWILGSGSDGTFAVYVSAIAAGVVTVTSTGLTTAIGTGNITNGAVTLAKLAPGVTPGYVVKLGGKNTSAGGSATVTITATGVVATDLAFAAVQASANSVSIQKVTAGTDQIVVLLSADPGAATICWQADRVAS